MRDEDHEDESGTSRRSVVLMPTCRLQAGVHVLRLRIPASVPIGHARGEASVARLLLQRRQGGIP